MTDVRILATGLGFPEGPVVMADGSVILTEIRNRRCSRVTADGKISVFSDNGGGPNGLAVGPDGALYCTNNGGSRYVEGKSMGQGPHPDYKGGSIQRLDPRTDGRPDPRHHVPESDPSLVVPDERKLEFVILPVLAKFTVTLERSQLAGAKIFTTLPEVL